MLPWFDIVYASIRSGNQRAGHPDGLDRQGGKLGHNVVIYRNAANGEADVECGVQLEWAWDPEGEVECVQTPVGKAATAAHYGPYSGIPAAHGAVGKWCQDNGLATAGVRWEVYGDWDNDPTKLRTDIFHLLK